MLGETFSLEKKKEKKCNNVIVSNCFFSCPSQRHACFGVCTPGIVSGGRRNRESKSCKYVSARKTQTWILFVAWLGHSVQMGPENGMLAFCSCRGQ